MIIVIISCRAVLIEMFFYRKRFDLSADTLRNVLERRNCVRGVIGVLTNKKRNRPRKMITQDRRLRAVIIVITVIINIDTATRGNMCTMRSV